MIKQISSEDIETENIPVYDVNGHYVLPGFIDVHTHGAVHVDVNAATAEDFEKLSQFFASKGTTSWLCSILTDSKEQTLWCIEQFKEYKRVARNGAELIGVHLEGPFLAPKFKGSMPEHLLRAMDMELLQEYQEAAQGGIRYITVAPEVDGVLENIEKMRELGMIVSFGHSGADYETAMKGIKSGANSITHTFNAMKLMHQHSPSIMGAALESDVYCEAICDGRHLHPGIVRFLIKIKGLDKVVAITDSIMATGLPDGKYKLGVNDIVVVDGDAKLADKDVRAGSTLTMETALKNLVEFTGLSLAELVPLLTENPAKMLLIDDIKGSIDIEKQADIIIINEHYKVVDTFVKGRQILKNGEIKI